MEKELKPVNCGCGGEAYPRSYVNTFHVTEDGYDHTVYCNKCNIETKMYDTEAEAVTAWNRAMSGSAEEKLKAFWDGMSAEMKEERTAKVVRKTKIYNLPAATPHVIYTREEWWDECENCNTTVEPSDRYCSHCGAKLDWSERDE